MISIQDIINYYMEVNPNRSSSTYSVMKFNLIRLEKITGKDINDLSIEDFTNTKKMSKLFEHYALNTQIQTIMGIKTFLKFKEAPESLILKWNGILKTHCDKTKIITEKNEMTNKEQKNWIEYPELKVKVKDFYDNVFFQYLDDDKLNDYQKFKWARDFLLLTMYTELPPARIGNYQFMKIRQKKKRSATSLDKKQNYLMVNGDGTFELVFNQYKTAKYLGQIDHTIDENNIISKILPKYIEIRDNFINNKKNLSLFVNKEKRDMTQSNITDTLKYITRKVVDKDLSVNLIRHIFISDFLSHNHNIEHKRKIANFMGQTYDATMMEKYNKKKIPTEKDDVNKRLTITFD